MPSHTWLLTGRYRDAITSNTAAVNEDHEQFETPCNGVYADYIKNPGCLQLYYGHYYSHNLYFRAVAEAFAGKADAAIADAAVTYEHAARFLPNEPGLQRYMAPRYMLLAAHGRWNVILDEKESPAPVCPSENPEKPSPDCHIAGAIWHWARGMAYTTAPKDPDKADSELKRFRDDVGAIPESTEWSNNKARNVLAVAAETLLARIDWAKNERDSAIDHLKKAVRYEDALKYDEPPQWVFPVRQSLGGAYLALHPKPTEGDLKAALSVFCIDLRKHPENGRSLYGVARALGELHNPWANTFGKRYYDAWGDSPKLTDDDLWLLIRPPVSSESASPANAKPGEEGFGPATAPPTIEKDPCSLIP